MGVASGEDHESEAETKMAAPANVTSPIASASLPRLCIVVPAYNEVENIPLIFRRLIDVTETIARCEVIFVDDGSSDGTRPLLRDLAEQDARLKYIVLSKNSGHQVALRAGLEQADADCVITMDADFQHPPEFIPALLDRWRQGARVVLTVRRGEEKLPLLKRMTSRAYYRILNALSEVRLEPGAADFRLIDRSVLLALKQFSEQDLFYRGVIPLVGFDTITVEYDLQEREFGTSKYSIQKMLTLAMSGIVSSSTRPLRLASAAAFIVLLFATLYGAFVLSHYIVSGSPISGWTSVILSILFLGGAQLLVLGIIGEYLAQLLKEARDRPPYIIAETNLRQP
jgi:glycosyltransferase involved in cell wall biosynthesis